MRIKKPFVIDDTRLFSSDIPEPAMGEMVWVSGFAYMIGAEVIRVQTHRKYIALNNVTSAIPPENDPLNWRDIGPTNRYAMFDYTNNVSSSADATMGVTVTLRPIQRVSCISIFGIDAQIVTVRQLDMVGGTVLRTWTFNLQTRFVSTWYEYLTAPFEFRTSVVVDDIPPTANSVFEIEFQKPGIFSVEYVAVGQPVFIGKIEYGAGSDILDFSRIERDGFGSATLVPRKNVPTLGGTLFVDKANVPKIIQFRKQNQATPLVFLGLEQTNDPYFEALSGIGIIKSMPILIEYPNHSLVNLEVEGL